MYHFRAKMPIDMSKIGAYNPPLRVDGWVSYERCKWLSCHAADLSYTFEVENQLDCNTVSKYNHLGAFFFILTKIRYTIAPILFHIIFRSS